MAAEAARVERQRHTGREHELADAEARRPRREPADVARDLVRGGRADARVVERGRRAGQDAALAGGVANDQTLAFGPCELDRDDLPEPASVALVEHDVGSGLESEPVQRRLKGKAAPVDRGRDRRKRSLESFLRVGHRAIVSQEFV